MDVAKIISELRSELEEIEEAIFLLERLDTGIGLPVSPSELKN